MILDAAVLHNSAPYTLARSAIEASATALWIFAPKDRPTRVGRRLELAAQDARDGTRMATDAGLDLPRPLIDRLAHIQALKERATGDGRLPRRLETSSIIRWVDAQHFSSVGALRLWQVGSGFAHGRLWPSVSVLQREAQPTAVPAWPCCV